MSVGSVVKGGTMREGGLMLKDKYKVKVTKEDIKKGERGVAGSCPIARAVQRATHRLGVSVGGSDILVNEVNFAGPLKCDDFVTKFDENAPVKPFSFVMRKVD